MSSGVESVGAQTARERRDKAFHVLVGAVVTLVILAAMLVAFGGGIAYKTVARPITPERLATAKPSCTKVLSSACYGKHIVVCQSTIEGRKVYSSEAC